VREQVVGGAVGQARVQRMVANGGDEYLRLLNGGEFRSICVVCRASRTMRSYHCKDCGRCVNRFDHHCPWIDNCVGLGNQRSFYCFMIVLFSLILSYYYIVNLYIRSVVLPDVDLSTFASWVESLVRDSLLAFSPTVVLASAIFDMMWVIFVFALIMRHTAYMVVNLTNFEVLVRPAHVVRRFPRARQTLWYLKGTTISDCIRHVVRYWTLGMDSDDDEFNGGGGGGGETSPLASAGAGERGGGHRRREGGGGAADVSGRRGDARQKAPANGYVPSGSGGATFGGARSLGATAGALGQPSSGARPARAAAGAVAASAVSQSTSRRGAGETYEQLLK